jgi:hypothetical protein
MGLRAVIDPIARAAHHAGGRALRHLGLLVDGVPNGLGQDKRLLGGRLDGAVVVYFPNPPRALYQVRQWYGPLTELHRRLGVTVITRDSRTAATIRAESALPVITVGYHSTIDDLLSRSEVQLALYVNFTADNFEMLRFGSLIHAALWHGDSDKIVSVSNQVKAFDFNLVPGQAAIDRLAANLHLFEAHTKCLIVGRPQVDTATRRAPEAAANAPGAAPGAPTAPVHTATTVPRGSTTPPAGPQPAPSDRIRVLYAPTWEGGHPSADYGSVEALGEAVARALIGDSRFALTYRPHPLTGLRLAGHGSANERIKAMVEAAGAPHRVSAGGPIEADFDRADVLVTDVSSVATDWLATGKPQLITVPADPAARVAPTALLERTPRLTVAGVAHLADDVATLASDESGAAARAELAAYYLYSTEPGASLAKFLTECERLVELNRTLARDAGGAAWTVGEGSGER